MADLILGTRLYNQRHVNRGSSASVGQLSFQSLGGASSHSGHQGSNTPLKNRVFLSRSMSAFTPTTPNLQSQQDHVKQGLQDDSSLSGDTIHDRTAFERTKYSSRLAHQQHARRASDSNRPS